LEIGCDLWRNTLHLITFKGFLRIAMGIILAIHLPRSHLPQSG